MIQNPGGTASDNVTRAGYGDYPLNTGDWTVLIQFKYNGSVAMGTYASVLNLFDGTTDFNDPYVFLGSSAATDEIYLEMFNGTTTDTSSVQVIVASTQNWCAITYNATTHIGTLIVNGSIVDTITVNMSTVVFDSFFLLGDGSVLNKTATSVAYSRAWSRILMASELIAEVASVTAVSGTGLLFDCPLQTSIDLTSHNNTLNQLVATGTVTTDTTDPLLTIVAGPPTNITPTLATTVTTESAYFQNTLSSGSAAPITWYKCTALTGTIVMGACAFGDVTTFKPKINVYEGLANANSSTELLSIVGQANTPIQFPVTPGLDYYFSSARNGAVSPAIVIISILNAPDHPIPTGSFIVNDDTEGFPAAFISAVAGEGILNYIQPFAAGEGGDILATSGLMLFEDVGIAGWELFSNQGIETNHLISDAARPIRAALSADRWYAAHSTGTSRVDIVNSDGTLRTPLTGFASTQFTGIAASPDNTILYYADNGTNTPIRRWDIVNNITLSNLVAGVGAGFKVGGILQRDGILVASDGTILVSIINGAHTSSKVIRYSAAGATLNTYDFTTDLINRITAAIDTNNFQAWFQPGPSVIDVFKEIKISDGSTVNSVTSPEFEDGVYFGGDDQGNTPFRFGSSQSCPYSVVRITIGPLNNAKSGLYILTGTGGNSGLPDNPILRHDVDWIDTSAGTSESVKIPDPFYDTYLVGDE